MLLLRLFLISLDEIIMLNIFWIYWIILITMELLLLMGNGVATKPSLVKQTITVLQKLSRSLNISNNFELPESCISNLEHSFSPVYYDAWENDNVNDPLLSLIHTIIL